MGGQALENLRQIGLPFLADVSWGTHICSFFESKSDLMDIVIPYFLAGLEHNELCVWVVSEPISVIEAISALNAAIPNLQSYSDQIEFHHYSEWYFNGDDLKEPQVLLRTWNDKTTAALARGYDGIRVCASTTWLDQRSWRDFIDYKARVQSSIGTLKMIALCSYQLSKCGMHEILGLVQNHHFSFLNCNDDYNYAKSMVKWDRVKIMSKLAASVAHEIRNPMTSVQGFLQLLQSDEDLIDHKHDFSLMIDELERANGIISGYLSLARQTERSIQKHDLNQTLTALLPLLKADALKEDKDVVLVTSEIEDILVDCNDIRQIVFNLVRNGLESMPAGGVLKMRTYMHNRDVILEVEDNGYGISQEVQAQLGKPFITTKEHGTGLGLYVTYSILKSYQASVQVTSTPQGTTFILGFPSADRIKEE
jgi:hypothetical protein